MLTYILLGICIGLLIVTIALLLSQRKNSNSAKTEELTRQIIDTVNKHDNTARIEELSRQMNDLVNKNYEQQVKVVETLNNNNITQTKLIQTSIASMQETITQNHEPTSIQIKGRHDPVIVPRAVVVVESMTAITLVDLLFTNMSARMDRLIDFYR